MVRLKANNGKNKRDYKEGIGDDMPVLEIKDLHIGHWRQRKEILKGLI